MEMERATLRTREGVTTEVSAEVKRYSAAWRGGVSTAVFFSCLIVGIASILVPGVHFVAPWLLPLLGAGVAYYLFNRVAVVVGARGVCPSCEREMAIDEGGALGNDPLWMRCPHCKTPMEFLDPAADR